MNYVTALLIGAALGIIQFAVFTMKKQSRSGHPIQALVVHVLIGGLIYGTLVWLIAKLF